MAHIHSETLDLCNNCLDLYVLTHYLVKINNILVYFCCLIIKKKNMSLFVMNDAIFVFKIIAVLVSKLQHLFSMCSLILVTQNRFGLYFFF